MLPDLLPSLPAPYLPPPTQKELRCDGCHIDLMKAPHDVSCGRRPQLGDVLRLATTPAERRVEDSLVTCHRRGVRAWLKSGRAL